MEPDEPARPFSVPSSAHPLPLLVALLLVAGIAFLHNGFWNGLSRYASGVAPGHLRAAAWGIAALLFLWGSYGVTTFVDPAARRILRTSWLLWKIPVRHRDYKFSDLRYIDFHCTAEVTSSPGREVASDSAEWSTYDVFEPGAPVFGFLVLLLVNLLGSGVYEVYLEMENRARLLCYKSASESQALTVAMHLSKLTGKRIG